MSTSIGWLTRFSKFSELVLVMTAQRYTHKSRLERLKVQGKRFAARDMAGGRKRRSLTLC